MGSCSTSRTFCKAVLKMNYTEEEKRIMENWPTVTEADVEAINAIFPHYLFFRWEKNAVEERSSCCRRFHRTTFPLRTETPEDREHFGALRHKERGVCPFCGAKVTMIDLKKAKGRKQLRSVDFVTVLHNGTDGALYADALAVRKNYETEVDLTAAPEYWCSSGYRFAPGEVLQLDHQVGGDAPYPKWERGKLGRKKRVQEPFKFGYISFYNHEPYRVLHRETVQENELFRYCEYFGAWQYRPLGARGYAVYFSDLISYLTAAAIYPRQVEMLVKAGLFEPVQALIDVRKKWADAFSWEEPDVRKSMRLTPPELREFLQSASGARMEWLCARNAAEKCGKVWSLDRAREWCRVWGEPLEALRLCRKYRIDPERLERYLRGQALGVEPVFEINTLLEMYRDYLDAAYEAGRCMEHGKVLWPDDLPRAHDAVTAERNRLLDAAAPRSERAKDLKARREKYEFGHDGLCIVFPATAGAIKREGKALDHCVGGYAERHVKGVLSIVFLRRADAPHVPYVTIEMHGNRIVQIHGYKNDIGKVSPRITHKGFIDLWLRWLEGGSRRDAEGRPILPKRRKKEAIA